MRGPADHVLMDERNRKPVSPLAFHAHDGRELARDGMELVRASVV